ncbi:MAG: DUF47 family protein [Bacillota bacterium]|nr:DUF47 family protein [Bacillota bacterium]
MFKKGKKVLELVDRHYNEVCECFNHFDTFLSLYLKNGKSEETVDQYHKIDLLEHDADSTRREIVSDFLEGTLLAQTRKEILQIVESVDKIANKGQDIARQMLYENVKFPEFVESNVTEISRLTKEQISILTKVLDILFDDYDVLIRDNSLLHEIKVMESKVDTVELDAVKKLFESDLDLAVKNHIKYFITKIADISDLVEDISDEIQVMVVFRRV